MKLKELVQPEKLLYKFEPDGGDAFNRSLTVRIHELVAQLTGKNATNDLGFLGCCAVANTSDMNPEIWIDFLFKKSTEAVHDKFSGKAEYHPKDELKKLENYLYAGPLNKNVKVIMRDIPEINARGEVTNVKKNVGVLRIYASLPICCALITNTNILEPSFLVRFQLAENSNSLMNEYVAPELVDSYLPINISVTTRYGADEFDPDNVATAIKETNKNLIAIPYAGKKKQPVQKRDRKEEKRDDRRKDDKNKKSSKREERESKPAQKKRKGGGGL